MYGRNQETKSSACTEVIHVITITHVSCVLQDKHTHTHMYTAGL